MASKSARCRGHDSGIHKYRRFKIGQKKNYTVYRCMNPGCVHYIEQSLIVGRSSICWMCDQEFRILAKKNPPKPICPACRPKYNAKFLPLSSSSQKEPLLFQKEETSTLGGTPQEKVLSIPIVKEVNQDASSVLLENILQDILIKSGK